MQQRDAFIAETGPGLTASSARKNCQLSVGITYPGGWQFSIFKADYRGYANLPIGHRGVARAAYYFSGQTQQIESNTNIVGPIDNNYIKTDTFGLESTVWSPCGYDGILNINSEVRIAPLTSPNPSLMTFDSADLKFTQVHYLVWQRC
ncbi:putative secreted protein [Eutypa lata UCREL1]|uniref:Putative secreted protein n=1 Tax=Eutypa lata (strain UCR-EL1) TaxID=1287681 RepID=M7TLL5_EUTLA|nr:putative secreted protein [Eutypa lata UCREL1]